MSLTLGDNSFHTNHVSEIQSAEGARRHMPHAKAALEPHVELLKLLGVRRVDGSYQILQSSLEGYKFTERIFQQAEGVNI